MSDLKDILGGAAGDSPLSEEQMMAYVEGRLSPAEMRMVEEALSEGGAESDALEGIRQLGAVEARAMTGQLNISLQQMLHQKGRRKRRGMAQQRWTLFAIGIILLLAVLCYAVMWMTKHPLQR